MNKRFKHTINFDEFYCFVFKKESSTNLTMKTDSNTTTIFNLYSKSNKKFSNKNYGILRPSRLTHEDRVLTMAKFYLLPQKYKISNKAAYCFLSKVCTHRLPGISRFNMLLHEPQYLYDLKMAIKFLDSLKKDSVCVKTINIEVVEQFINMHNNDLNNVLKLDAPTIFLLTKLLDSINSI